MKSLTLIASDRMGLIAEISQLFARRGINIADINARSMGRDAVIHLVIARDLDTATLQALEERGYHLMAEEAILVRVRDEPGALAQLSRLLADAQIDIRGLTMMQRQQGHSLVAIGASDPDRARVLLAGVLVE